MTGTKTITVPTIGSKNEVADPRVKAALEALLEYHNAILDSNNKLDLSTFTFDNSYLTQSKFRWYTPVSIATEQSRENTAYGKLATPDEVENVVVGTDGLMIIGYLAAAKSTVASAASAAIFLNSTQLKGLASGGAAVQSATLPGTSFAFLYSTQKGLTAIENGPSLVTTGTVLGTAETSYGSFCIVYVAPGEYDVSIQFKATSGKATVKERKLWVATMG